MKYEHYNGKDKYGDEIIHFIKSINNTKRPELKMNPDFKHVPNLRSKENIIVYHSICGIQSSASSTTENKKDVTCLKCLQKLDIPYTRCSKCNRRIINDIERIKSKICNHCDGTNSKPTKSPVCFGCYKRFKDFKQLKQHQWNGCM